ncbi:zinc finger protein 62 homolog isoform X1 [Biomphalaria glabrata]|uniref:Zinc finger protein 62 homolog isoform X1 n=2 Tax=Biomphalaria glabrata TaxID=6526 RepID=A0A9U8EJK5_BIOGL|nr:zinc finger protein 62 homolog isoform X1 [Biomphalaria glabrata]
MKQNYEAMTRAGLKVKPPEFMMGKKDDSNHKPVLHYSDTDGSDSDWTPDKERSQNHLGKKKTLASLVRKSKSSQKHQSPKPSKEVENKTIASENVEKTQMYSLRNSRNTGCIALPDEDDYIFCQECFLEYVGDCPEHGGLNIVLDAVVPSDSRKGKDEDYSKKTLPEGLVIKSSEIPEAGLGVFATKFFPSRTRFGPYLGKIVTNKMEAHKSGYSWQIYKNGKASHFVNADDPSNSNWMRFVNCSRSEDEQSVQAYQHRGHIYFIAHKAIQPNTEILVYYGDSYAKLLGIPLQKSEQSKKKQADNQKGDLHCNFCPLVFVSFHFYIESHLKHQHPEHYWNLINMCQRKDTTQTDSEKCEISKQSDKSCACYLKTKRFACNMCAKTFTDLQSMRTHVFTHTGEKTFQCDLCEKQFTHLRLLKSHKLIHSSEKPFVCNICGEGFKQTHVCRSHKYRKHKDLIQKRVRQKGLKNMRKGKRFFCNICDKTFSESYSWKVHQLMHTQEPLPCVECGQKKHNKSSSCSLNLYTHLLIDKRFSCTFCGKKFIEKYTLKRHILSHTGEKPFQCDECDRRFTQQRLLKSHKLTHASEKPFVCDVCGKGFKHPSACRLHKYRKHKDSIPTKIHPRGSPGIGKYYVKVCNVCGKHFRRLSTLKQHQVKHTREPLTCDECGKTFRKIETWKLHKSLHSCKTTSPCDECGQKQHYKSCSYYMNPPTTFKLKVKKFTCNMCDRKLADMFVLRKHLFMHTQEKPFQCDVCNRQFAQLRFLKNHKLIHSSEKPFACDVCGKSYKQPSSCKIHVLRKHPDIKPIKVRPRNRKDTGKQFLCDVCGQVFARSLFLKQHQLKHTQEPCKCDECGQIFKTIHFLNRHKSLHLSKTLIACDECGKIFRKADTLRIQKGLNSGVKTFLCDACFEKQHSKSCSHNLNSHTHFKLKEKRFACNMCAKKFIELYQLRNHLIVHTEEKPFQCDVCDKTFTQQRLLKSHKLTHASEKPFVCDVCGKGYKQPNACRIHKYRKHIDLIPTKVKHKRLKDAGKHYVPVCTICGLSFTRLFALKKHQLKHTQELQPCKECGQKCITADTLMIQKCLQSGQMPFSCDECGKKFRLFRNLQRHKYDHTGERPFKCDICHKGFKFQSLLKNHKFIHLKEKPFKCEMCCQHFSNTYQMQSHIFKHTGKRPFKCKMCGKRFTFKTNWKKHKFIHLKEKPFKCEICGKSFSDAYRMQRHLRMHIGIKPFQCDVCHKGFPELYRLNKHKKYACIL